MGRIEEVLLRHIQGTLGVMNDPLLFVGGVPVPGADCSAGGGVGRFVFVITGTGRIMGDFDGEMREDTGKNVTGNLQTPLFCKWNNCMADI